MTSKTKIQAETDRQEVFITRDFDLPVELLFKAYSEASIVEQWMGTRVLILENRKGGTYQFETTDPQGNQHGFQGVIHEFVTDHKITRTFEMEGTPFGVQLEFYQFKSSGEGASSLQVHTLYESVAQRDQILKFGMPRGLGMAHDRIQAVLEKLRGPL